MNLEDIKEKDIGREAKFTFSKNAFRDKELTCDNCNVRMKRVRMVIDLPNTELKASIEVFRCGKCNTEYLNGEQAKKFDKALILAKALSEQGLVFERALNNDGDNYLFRFPAQLTRGWKRYNKIDINPLTATEFLIKVKG